MEGKKFEMGEDSDLGCNETEVKEKMEQFYRYCAEEKLERHGQLYGLKGSLAALHNSAGAEARERGRQIKAWGSKMWKIS